MERGRISRLCTPRNVVSRSAASARPDRCCSTVSRGRAPIDPGDHLGLGLQGFDRIPLGLLHRRKSIFGSSWWGCRGRRCRRSRCCGRSVRWPLGYGAALGAGNDSKRTDETGGYPEHCVLPGKPPTHANFAPETVARFALLQLLLGNGYNHPSRQKIRCCSELGNSA
jgi:hypothetical protein